MKVSTMLGFALLALVTGCVSMDSTDATRDPDFLITESPDLDEPYKPMGFIRVEKFGWYLFGLFPIVPVSLDGLVWDLLVPEAKRRGADGLLNFKYEIDIASFWRFQLLGAVPVPDWSAKGVVTGMAIRREKGKAKGKGD